MLLCYLGLEDRLPSQKNRVVKVTKSFIAEGNLSGIQFEPYGPLIRAVFSSCLFKHFPFTF